MRDVAKITAQFRMRGLAAADNRLHDTGRWRLLAFLERRESVNKAKAILGENVNAICRGQNSAFL